METPKNTRLSGSTRNPTPRLSERKKNLFSSQKNVGGDLMEGIVPIDSTEPNSVIPRRTPKSKRCIGSSLTCMQSPKSTRFFSDDQSKNQSTDNSQDSPSPTRRSLRLNPKASSSLTEIIPKNKISGDTANTIENGKENVPVCLETEEHLQRLFDTSMNLSASKPKKKTKFQPETKDSDEPVSCDEPKIDMAGDSKKRQIHKSTSMGLSPKRKVPRVENNPILPITTSIPTRSFYSHTNTSPVVKSSVKNVRLPIISPKSKRQNLRNSCNINKGVTHKIRKKSKNTTAFTRYHRSTIDIDHILNNVRNEKLRNLITSKRQEKLQIEKLDQIYKNNQNPIEMARPLSTISAGINYNNNNNNEENPNANMETPSENNDLEFSDIECDDYLEEDLDFEDVIPSINHEPDETIGIQNKSEVNRKFFKSGRSTNTRKEVKITDNIKALVCNGKISLVQEKKRTKKKIKIKNSLVNEFSDEQATVDEILKNLDDTAFGDITLNNNENVETTPSHNDCNQLNNDVIENKEDTYSEFLNRIPYKTSDPELIQQQKLLLDFLINNNICTEENFTIFIADPDNHKEEASRIVDQVIVVVNEQSEFRQRIPYNTNDPLIIQQQNNFLDFLIEHNICTEENFDIFIANYDQRCDEAEAIVHNVLAQIGNDPTSNSNTYSEDYIADSQKLAEYDMEEEIGDQNQYSVNTINDINGFSSHGSDTNSPTSELSEKPQKLFSIFCKPHFQPFQQKSTRKTLRTWTGGNGANQYQIDAGQKSFGAQQCKHCGLVYTVHEPEEEKLHKEYHASLHVLRFKGWIDEDIVAIYSEWAPDGRIIRISESSHPKRKERLMDVLKLVDTELGFSSYIFPKSFIAYFAVRKYQIVGLCLVQPLQKANRYICVNGIDCCTEEEFEAKCGISRIWVSPLHRRLHIGSKLIKAVQFNTIFGEEIALDKIAFSAPTENGKNFARNITNMENFLVYQ